MTPRDMYGRMRRNWIGNSPTFDASMLTDDVVVQSPFSGHSVSGRDQVLAYIRAGHASVPFRFTDCRTLALHETTDPQTIVVEYELHGTMNATGATASAPFIGVLTTRDGRIAGWREYQNPVLIAAAMQGPGQH
jgi:ketosteroid isomerase-like protein